MADHFRQGAYRWDRRGQDFEQQARLAKERDDLIRAAELRKNAAMCFEKADGLRQRSNLAQRRRRERAEARG